MCEHCLRYGSHAEGCPSAEDREGGWYQAMQDLAEERDRQWDERHEEGDHGRD